jgi:hypothetical protein
LGPGTPWLEESYEWQLVLARGIEYETIVSGDWSGIVVERITGEPMTSSDIDEITTRRPLRPSITPLIVAEILARYLDLPVGTVDSSS